LGESGSFVGTLQEASDFMIRVFFRRVLDAYRTEYAYSIEITPSASKQPVFPDRFIRAEQKHTNYLYYSAKK